MSEKIHDHNGQVNRSWVDQFASDTDLSILQTRLDMYKCDDNESLQDEEAYIHFRLGDKESYAVNYKFVEEILNPHKITPVPCVPDYIAGVINRRSNLLAVYDLRKLFSLKQTQEEHGKIWVIIITSDEVDFSACILANEVFGNDTYVIDELAPPLQATGARNVNYVKGIIDGRITLLDVGAILLDENIRVNG